MKKNLAAKSQQKISRGFFRELPHHGLLKVASRLDMHFAVRAVSRIRDVKLQKSKLIEFSQSELSKYEKSFKSAKLWHGSGRYKYETGGVFDILANILEYGAINPMQDIYAVSVGMDEMSTISTTPLRMIARSYADTFGAGSNERSRYGSSEFWATYFYGMFYAMLFSRYAVTTFRNWSRWREKAKNDNGSTAWGQKVHKASEHVWDTFILGSDIVGNFPIVYAIRDYSDPVKLPESLAKAEVRLQNPVKISELSHIEVPLAKIGEAKKMLSQFRHGDVKVFAIELGEYYASQQDFHELVGL